MQNCAPNPAWYVAVTRVRKGVQAQRILGRQGFASACLRCFKVRSHARRAVSELAPMLPGYLFVRFSRDCGQ